MQYFLIFISGIALGFYFWYKMKNYNLDIRHLSDKAGERKTTIKKKENKMRILRLLQEKKSVVNNDVEKMLGVSDATATNYLTELEAEGEITQINETGRGVYYKLK